MTEQRLDEAYERLHATGPEFDGWLSNHGPMAVEAMVRHGHVDDVSRWLDAYSRRLEQSPRYSRRIDDWQSALGDARRLGDWIGWFDEQLRELPWAEVLSVWWPRLLPGIAAGATHGVIRVGHAVRVLREHGESPARVSELAQGLGYWAARWQPVPRAVPPDGQLPAQAAIAALPTVPDQRGGITSRLSQLDDVDGWTQAQRALAPHDDWQAFLRDVVTAAVLRYSTHAHGNAVMLVHAATAPNAVLRALPSLPEELWAPSAAAAWSASAAVHAAYAPTDARPLEPAHALNPAGAFDRAVQHGDEHAIKLADTALDVCSWESDARAVTAIQVAVALIEPED